MAKMQIKRIFTWTKAHPSPSTLTFILAGIFLKLICFILMWSLFDMAILFVSTSDKIVIFSSGCSLCIKVA